MSFWCVYKRNVPQLVTFRRQTAHLNSKLSTNNARGHFVDNFFFSIYIKAIIFRAHIDRNGHSTEYLYIFSFAPKWTEFSIMNHIKR